MDAKQREFLAQRRSQGLSEQPRLAELEHQLLACGGEAVVFRPESDLELILRRGRKFAGRSILVQGPAGDCHRDVARFWRSTRDRTCIVTGWALSEDDDLWRQHSWLLRRNVLIETTVKRTSYFGVVLTDHEAEAFAARLRA